MRLLVVGRLSGQLATAVKMAMAHGAKVQHVERADQATEQLRRGQGADLMMVDYRIDIAALIAANDAERIHVPIVACGVDADAKEAADAIRAGAKEFIPLPPEADLIAAFTSPWPMTNWRAAVLPWRPGAMPPGSRSSASVSFPPRCRPTR